MYDSTHVITKNAAISRCRYGDGDGDGDEFN